MILLILCKSSSSRPVADDSRMEDVLLNIIKDRLLQRQILQQEKDLTKGFANDSDQDLNNIRVPIYTGMLSATRLLCNTNWLIKIFMDEVASFELFFIAIAYCTSFQKIQLKIVYKPVILLQISI